MSEAERRQRLCRRAGCFCTEADLEGWVRLEDVEPAMFAAEKALSAENDRLRAAGAKICDGFDEGIFVRSILRDSEPAWAIKLYPYLQALAVFADEEKNHD